MANTEILDIENKFIFTNEGRRMLTAQLNGIRFAILGAILVQGIEPIKLTDEDKQRNPIDDEGHSTSPFYNAMRTLNLEELINTPDVMIGIKDVDYIAQGNQRIGVDDLNAYHNILDEIESHLIPLYYIPSQELQDNYGNIYGTYNFEFDRTTISVAWPGTDDDMAVSFAHICLIGKQYAETNDATFNVNLTQRPVIVGVAQLDGEYEPATKTFTGGAQLLKEENKYLATKIMLRFTLDENDYDATFVTANQSEEVKEVLDISKKLSLINNGLKTDVDQGITMKIAENKTVVEDLNLNSEGSLAIAKTLMVADPYRADKLDNQWNAAGLVHIINKEDVDNETYKQQLILTTLEHYEDLTEPITTYNAELFLRGKGLETAYAEIYNPYLVQTTPSGSGSSGSSDISDTLTAQGEEAPIFKMDAVPENDRYAVEIFGYENNYFGYNNIDKTIFSNNNITFNPGSITDETLDDTDGNILFNSNYNYINGANLDNTLINSDYNYLNTVLSNMLIGADANIIMNDAAGNLLLATNYSTLDGSSTESNLILGGITHYIKNGKNNILLGQEGLMAVNKESQLLMGSWNKDSNAKIVYGIGQDDANRKNAFEYYPETGELKLYSDYGSNLSVTLGGTAGISLPAGKGIQLDRLTANNLSSFNIWSQFLKVGPAPNNSEGSMIMSYNSYNNGKTHIPYFMFATSDDQHSFFNYSGDNIYFGTVVEPTTGISFGSEATLSAKSNTIILKSTGESMAGTNYSLLALNANTSYAGAAPYSEQRPAIVLEGFGPSMQNGKTFIDNTGITLYEENSDGAWVEVKRFDRDTGLYNKVRADVYIWGGSETSWHAGALNIVAPSNEIKKWITDIFQVAPPILYNSGNQNPKPSNTSYIGIFSGANPETISIDKDTYTSVANLIKTTNYSNTLYCGNQGGDDCWYYYSYIPDYFNIDEIELNIFVHDFDNCDIGFIWIPIRNVNKNAPLIKATFYMEEDGEDQIAFFHNQNYWNKIKYEQVTIKGSKPIRLKCIPGFGTITGGPVTPTDEVSNAWGWFIDQPD